MPEAEAGKRAADTVERIGVEKRGRERRVEQDRTTDQVTLRKEILFFNLSKYFY